MNDGAETKRVKGNGKHGGVRLRIVKRGRHWVDGEWGFALET